MKSSIFNNDFFPTPVDVIEIMTNGITLEGKTILEPSAGKGDIVDFLKQHGADVIACEKQPDLVTILSQKCPVLSNDFLTVKAEQISHIHAIIMNPPFSADEKHILHAWQIAPDGCRIVSLCNSETTKNTSYRMRIELQTLISQYGQTTDLGQCFSNAERKTEVNVSMVSLLKPGAGYDAEFDGFFMEEDPAEQQANAIMSYNVVRDLVNRYVQAVKVFDEQLETATKINKLISQFYNGTISLSCTEDGKPKLRNEFKKDLQKSAWNYIFRQMDMGRFTTSGLRADINKFVEQQTQIPFTMRNIYRMIDIVIGTQEQRMDKALLEVFNKVTQHYSENRYNLEGWKTNSHYLLNRKFILPHVVQMGWSSHLRTNYYGWADPVEDLQTALCHFTATDPKTVISFSRFLDQNEVKAGEFHSWGFFDFRAFKKGTVHFTFQDEKLWMMFNQRIAKILGYPLPESMKPKASETEKSPIVEEEKTVENLPALIAHITDETDEETFEDFDNEDELEEVYANPDQLSIF